ncbi:hypothetical protein KUF71_009533 [Frankliniella fusca]|uniref:Uncharacterized protein n=1 Tax=Frankliniella fusca TaxID=407009 RepID=A0AAE1HF69_9NEOP|nr:hypothetical protein KUF71_009533 [Frankliniella fusca]
MADGGKSGFGHFKPYGSVDIEMYLKRFTSYLFTKNVTPPAEGQDRTKYDIQRKNWLLSEIGPEAYAVLDGLCGAGCPEDKTVTQLEDLLKTHFKPKRNKNTEREKFYARKQGNETVSEFSVSLYQLSKFCEFGEFLDQALQTQFINNLRSLKVKEKVAEGSATFSEVVANAAKFEQMYGSEVTNPILMVNKDKDKKKKSTKEDNKKSQPGDKDKKGRGKIDISKVRCFNCNKHGHYASSCKEPKKAKKPQDKTVHVVEQQNDSLALYPLLNTASDRIPMQVELNGIPITMELDTAAKASTIDKFLYKKFFSDCPLRKTTTLVWGEPLPMLGEFEVEVTYNNQCKTLVLPVVDKEFPSLYGLPWIREIRPDFDSLFPRKTVFHVSSEQEKSLQAELRQKYPTVFGGSTKPLKGFEVSLALQDDVEPVFKGPRTLAIPLREPTAKALQDMEDAGYIKRSEPGPWGTPIVPVRKSNGEVRVCGDFSVTLNPHLVVSGRALPLIDDLSTVNGKVFCILDLKMAYLQLPLSPASQELCKLNTPCGTYACLRMPFGISSAPGAFQEVISTILAGIDQVFMYLDDILLWGQDEADCLKTLHKVLERLEHFEVKLNLNKCKFLQHSVIYLGFQLDQYGSRPNPARMDELLKKPRPTDHTQLKSFLGMITFFHKYGQNLASVLKPLYQLKKSPSFYWSENEQVAYDKALELLSTTVLVPYSLHRPLRLTSDASPVGAGCVLSHVNAQDYESVEADIYWVQNLPTDFISAEDIAEKTLQDGILKKVLHYVMHGWPDVPEEELKPFSSKYLELSAENNCLLWNGRAQGKIPMMPIGTNALFLRAEYLCPWAAPKPMGSSHSQPMGITCPLAGTIAHSQLAYRNALPIVGDLVWVRNYSRGKTKWHFGIIETVVSSVSYDVQVKDKVRQVSSSHLRPRSPFAESIEVDALANFGLSDSTAPVVPCPPPQQPDPQETPVPEPVVEPVFSEAPIPSPVKTPVVQSSPVAKTPVRNSSPIIPPVSTPKRSPPGAIPKTLSQPEPPAPVQKFSSRGRPIIPPRRLLD